MTYYTLYVEKLHIYNKKSELNKMKDLAFKIIFRIEILPNFWPPK